MKFLLGFICLFIVSGLFAQDSQPQQRHIQFKHFDNDSVNFSLDTNYHLVEDSCAQIIRYGHFHFSSKTYSGKFKDVSKTDTNLILSAGNYSSKGVMDGPYISHYLNGNLRATGSFKNNNYDGRWETYYNDGNPELIFEGDNNKITIIDYWAKDGKHTVINGNGAYKVDYGNYYWSGNLINGVPDGTWKFITEAFGSVMTQDKEYFKNGKFAKGNSPLGNYSDSSHISLIRMDLLPCINAEKLLIGRGCGPSVVSDYTYAKYSKGDESFKMTVGSIIQTYLETLKNNPGGGADIEGIINEKGYIVNLHSLGDGRSVTDGLVRALNLLPTLQPATKNNKPVSSKFKIHVQYFTSSFRFNYSFLAL